MPQAVTLAPRCQYCGLVIMIWRIVSCKEPVGHSARGDIGIVVPCDAEDCNLAAGHHGAHKETQ